MVFSSRLCLSSADATAASIAPAHKRKLYLGLLKGFLRGSYRALMVFSSRLCLSSADATAASMAPEHKHKTLNIATAASLALEHNTNPKYSHCCIHSP